MLESHLFSHIPDLETDSDGNLHYTVTDRFLFLPLRTASVPVSDLSETEIGAIVSHINAEQKLAGMKAKPQTDIQYQLTLRDRDASNALMPPELRRKHKG